MDKMQTLLALLLVAIVAGIVGYGTQVMKITDMQYDLDTQESNIESLKSDKVALSSVSNDLKNDIANKVRELDSKNAELKSKNEEISAKESVIESKKTEITDLITTKELAEQRAAELEKRFELQKEEVETASEVNGVVFDELDLNDQVPKTIDGYDLPDKLYNGKIYFDGNDYYVREEFKTIVTPETSLITNAFCENVYLTNTDDSFVYTYTFTTELSISDICDEHTDTDCDKDPLVINFAGKELSIVGITENEITVKDGNLKYIKLGGTLDYNDKTITLDVLGTNFVYVNVNGETAYIKQYKSKTVNGVDIRLEGISDMSGNEGCLLIIGDDVYRTYENDEYDFGDDYRFEIETIEIEEESENVTYLKSFSLIYEPSRTDLEDEDGFVPFASGESLNFLEFLTVSFDGITERVYTTYTINLKTKNDEDYVKINTESETIKVNSDRIDTIYINNDNVYYKINKEYKTINLCDAPTITFENGKTVTTLKYEENTFSFKINGFEQVKITTDYSELNGTYDVDKTVRTDYGTLIKNPVDNNDDNRVVISIPDKVVTAEFSIC